MLYLSFPIIVSFSPLLCCHFQGWQLLASADMNSFFQQVAVHEWEAVRELEPFDEYEEWHLKCGHYLLVCAMKGDCTALGPALNHPVQHQAGILSPLEAHARLPVRQGDMHQGSQPICR